ncbi:MAG TPA: phosphate ABC transporter permease PstA [Thiotrichales bacterium]|nr:phosphate ABC transporter permease PstA [Thiotrichales bacterium]
MSIRAWYSSGTPFVWLTAGAVSISVIMVVGLLLMILARGLGHFWPAELHLIEYRNADGETQTLLGEIRESEQVPAVRVREAGYPLPDDAPELVTRHLFKVGNRDLYGFDFRNVVGLGITGESLPAGATAIERRTWGNFYGFPVRLEQGGEVIAEGDAVWEKLPPLVERAHALHEEIRDVEQRQIGAINYEQERLRLAERRLELEGIDDPATRQEIAESRAALQARFEALQARLAELREQEARDTLVMRSADGREVPVALANLVRIYRPNTMGVMEKLGFYGSRLWEFVSDEPREANTEGGIFPAIFGTVMMVLIMSVLVTPMGVVAAVYLREYARQGPVTRLIRIAVNNLAGVPSIVYGVFGLGFFVYFLGGNIDRLFFPEALPAPTFGTPGILWASLTLAILTLPVVIVSTEEGLARIPRSIREGSLALGATKAETLWRTVLPMASPAMMTGLILAVARAAGEVAPLMLVGVVKLAPSLPLDGNFPFLHLERKFMHLGFHIYDVGFQSPNVEAARPLVYATSFILVLVIVVLNLTAIAIRNHLREKYRALEG